MSNSEGGPKPGWLRFGVPNDATDEQVEAFSPVVAAYFLEGVIFDPMTGIERNGTVVELSLRFTAIRELEPYDGLTPDGQEERDDMEFVLHDIEFDKI